MNKLPPGTEPRRFPMTIIYRSAGEPLSMDSLKRMPVTATGKEEAEKLLKLLVPGAILMGISNGHSVDQEKS